MLQADHTGGELSPVYISINEEKRFGKYFVKTTSKVKSAATQKQIMSKDFFLIVSPPWNYHFAIIINLNTGDGSLCCLFFHNSSDDRQAYAGQAGDLAQRQVLISQLFIFQFTPLYGRGLHCPSESPSSQLIHGRLLAQFFRHIRLINHKNTRILRREVGE